MFASEYWFEAYDLPYPKRVITDTGKTQYLFRINKGVEDLGESINQHMPEAARPIPFANMIYFGDGDTDVPSMAVMRKNGGHAVAVYPPGKGKSKCVELFKAGRCDFFAPADYRAGSDLFKRTCLLLDRILADIRVQEEMWRLGREAGPGEVANVDTIQGRSDGCAASCSRIGPRKRAYRESPSEAGNSCTTPPNPTSPSSALLALSRLRASVLVMRGFSEVLCAASVQLGAFFSGFCLQRLD